VLLGEGGVGKTSIAHRLIDDDFKSDLPSTVGADLGQKILTVNGTCAQLAIWDTAGQEVFRSLTPQYYRDAQMALVVFSVTDKRSFDEAAFWIRSVRAETPSAVITLVANKIDLDDTRVVSFDLGETLADEFNIAYVETSAQTGQGVVAAFEGMLARYLLDRRDRSLKVSVESGDENTQPFSLTQPPVETKCCL
jgi:small GTP-binding protein